MKASQVRFTDPVICTAKGDDLELDRDSMKHFITIAFPILGERRRG
jgi:hypothetical protein